MSAANGHKLLLKSEQKFTENKGQWDSRAHFVTRSNGMDIWFEDRGIDFDYYVSGGSKYKRSRLGQIVRMEFAGKAGPLKYLGMNPVGDHLDFLIGKTRTLGVGSYQNIEAASIYPGVDLRAYYNEERARYDLVVAANADPSVIKVRFKGANSLKVASQKLVLGTQVGNRAQGDLFAYQTVNGRRKEIPAKFCKLDQDTIGFKLGSYDHSRPLIIDPVVYGTYYGGDFGLDEVRSVAADTDGGVFMTGDTQAFLFPAIYGPYGYNLNGQQNAFLSKLEGDAYNHVYAAFIGGSVIDSGESVKLDPFGNVWIAGETESSDFPGNSRQNVMTLVGDSSATGGTFTLTYGGEETAAIPYDANTVQVQSALNALGALNGLVQVTSLNGTALSNGGSYTITLDPSRPLVLQVNNVQQGFNAGPPNYQFTMTSQGLPAKIIVSPQFNPPFPPIPTTASQTISRIGSDPTNFSPPRGPDTFTLTFTNQPTATAASTTATTTALPDTATAAQVQAALVALANVGAGNCAVSGGPVNTTPLTVSFFAGAAQYPMTVANQGNRPSPAYAITKLPLVFVLPFARDAQSVLAPLGGTQTMMFGSKYGQAFQSFDVLQVAQPTAGMPVTFVLNGDINNSIQQGGIPDIGQSYPGQQSGWMAVYTFNPTTYAYTQLSGFYITGQAQVSSGGAVFDPFGNILTAGTVYWGDNVDTSQNPGVFQTTSNVWYKGQLLREDDIFIRKYTQQGGLLWSGLLGGHGNDYCGGFDQDTDGSRIKTGSAIGCDVNGNAFVAGQSNSYDYPRSRGTYGQVFTDNANMVVTEVSSDGTQILYSTNLNFGIGCFCMPAGIAIDPRGDAFVSGNIHPSEVFPENVGNPASDPEQPITNVYSSISPNPIVNGKPLYETIERTPSTKTAPDLGNCLDWLVVLNSTASDLIFDSYLSGPLNNRVYAPYVDSFGDAWVFGWTDSGRFYQRVSSTGGVTTYNDTAALPIAATPPVDPIWQSMITPLAFKPYPDSAGGQQQDMTPITTAYGSLGDEFAVSPLTISAKYARDGWLLKLRLGLPAVQSLTFNPNVLPGGLGASTTGTVTLTNAAPSTGATITLSVISGTAVSFDPNNPSVTSTTITIPAGATTGTFVAYTEPVTVNSPVTIQADLAGADQSAGITVVPWLRGLQISPNSLVGGNTISGIVTLAAVAPPGGVTVTIGTDTPSVVTVPSGGATVPGGQTSATFTMPTAGVAKDTAVNISASLLKFVVTNPATIDTASLSSLTFNPQHVPGGSSSVGTVSLNGLAGSPITITVDGDADAGFTGLPTTLTIPAQSQTATFTVGTPIAPAVAQLNVTATMAAQGNYAAGTVTTPLFIDSYSITNFALNDAEIPSGGTTQGTITIAQPAPAGGVLVNVSTSNPLIAAINPNTPGSSTYQVTVPEGQASVQFPVNGGFIAAPAGASALVSVSRNGQTLPQGNTPNLLVDALGVSLSLDPGDVLGGATAQGTITISAPAPPSGLLFNVSAAPSGLVSLPSTVLIPGGATSNDPSSFLVSTSSVSSSTSVDITATWKDALGNLSTPVDQMLGIEPVGVLSLSFSNYTVKQRVGTTQCTITLSGPAPAGGALVTITQDPYLLTASSTQLIPAGQTSYTFSMRAKAVSRDLADTVTATYPSADSASAVVVITR